MTSAITALTALASLATAPPEGFSVGIELPNQVPVVPAVERALDDMDIDYANFYINTQPPGGHDEPWEETLPQLTGLCERLGLDFSLSCHIVEPPEEAVRRMVDTYGEDADIGFEGIVWDELAHIRIMHFVDVEGLAPTNDCTTFEEAYDVALEDYKQIVARYQEMGCPVTATHVLPILNHLAARSGMTPCPKICKELFSPISLALGMGAAKQYDRPLWVDCDLWYYDLLPGHGAEEFRSNLLLAYWMGADRVYVEGAGFNLLPSGRSGIPVSLMTPIRGDLYHLTPHGEVLRWFCREYLPSHPRPYTFRDLTPQVVIVRADDTCHGQRYSGFDDELFGSPHLHSDASTEAWFALWDVLTQGHAGRDGLTFFKSKLGPAGAGRPMDLEKGFMPSYSSRPRQAEQHPFWTPLSGVVVYDHTVGYDLLANVPLICVTGTRVSDETWAALERRVEEGAVCLCWAPLTRERGMETVGPMTVIERGGGKWVLTDDFGRAEVFQQIWPWVGRPDEIRYRFGGEETVLRKVTGNEVRVERYSHGEAR